MKAIILAAGRGSRLAPITDTIPKCMVEYNGRSLISTIIDVFNSAGISDISIVGGYKIDVLKVHLEGRGIRYYENKEYAKTNMVYSLFCAVPEMIDDVIISYSDIIYSKEVIRKLINESSPIAVVTDKGWIDLWKLRMDNPLDDAESLKLDSQINIIELGRKTTNYSDISGQYIGLIKIRKDAWRKVIDFYSSLDPKSLYDGKDLNNMFMTSFLQNIIEQVMPVKAVMIDGGWLEIDSLSDLKAYEQHNLKID